MIIKEVKARKIKTSNGNDTIEITINKKYTASSPLGTSTGEHEVEPFHKKGVDFCIKAINNSKELLGSSFDGFEELNIIEKHFKHLGGNSVLALQYAILRAMADNEVWKFLNPNADKMPIPLGNVIGGGAHFNGKAADFQEYLLVPKAGNFADNAFANSYIHKQVGREYPNAKKTMEGAYGLNFNNVRVLDFLKKIIIKTEKELGFKIGIGIDVAASSFFKNNKYNYKNHSYFASKKSLTKKEQIEFINKLAAEHDIEYLEDPLHENDFNGFKEIKAKLVCGDDLICTNLERLKKAAGKINAVIIKPNQMGSITKTKEVVDFAVENGITPVMSHRSGETMDTMISHLAVAWEIPYIKLGIYGKERAAKIKELIRIEKMTKRR